MGRPVSERGEALMSKGTTHGGAVKPDESSSLLRYLLCFDIILVCQSHICFACTSYVGTLGV